MNAMHNGWFSELSPGELSLDSKSYNVPQLISTIKDDKWSTTFWEGQVFSLKCNNVLYEQKSQFQDILVFESASHGRVLVLDGIIQCTEKDECSYQEMIAHIPMTLHDNPENILIIGGGDGGVLREVLKHKTVKTVTLCEIDQEVVEVSKKFLPSMSHCFDDPRVTVRIGDGLEFVSRQKNVYDVIITDSSDPVGPAESLFGTKYYESLHSALTKYGVCCSQSECIWHNLSLIKSMMMCCNAMFKNVAYAYTSVPTYPSGTIGFLLCSKEENDLSSPSRILTDMEMEEMGLKFYDPILHSAAFCLPRFVRKALSVPGS